MSFCAYIQWASLAGLDLYFDATQMDLNYCMAMSDAKQYSVSYGLPELWKLGSYEFLRELNKTAKDLLDGKSVTHKFTHYAAHAETLSQFFDGLGLHQRGRSFPSSAMIFEFLKLSNNTLALRLLYWEAGTQSESVLKFPGQLTDFLTLDTFLTIVQNRLELAGGPEVDLVAKCKDTESFKPAEDEYYSGNKVLEDLQEVYELRPVFNGL